MKTALLPYLCPCVCAFWPHISNYQRHEAKTVITEVVMTTDATPLESLEMLNIAALESGFDTHAVGKGGERGAFQVSTDGGRNHDFSAREALRRMRVQGMIAYVGC